jgi:hypothetical protein
MVAVMLIPVDRNTANIEVLEVAEEQEDQEKDPIKDQTVGFQKL